MSIHTVFEFARRNRGWFNLVILFVAGVVAIVGLAQVAESRSQVPTDCTWRYSYAPTGSNLYSLAKEFDVYVEQIRAVNPGKDWGKLQAGTPFAVPVACK